MMPPRICATITNSDLKAIQKASSQADLLEVRIDLIGDDWEKVAGQLNKPWIACNRTAAEGGRWQGNEARRIEKLLQAVEMGADTVDIELRTKNLANIVKLIKRRAKCLVSYHDLEKTPPFAAMKRLVEQQTKAGADICKVVTTARSFEDNLSVLRLIREFPGARVVAFAMGPQGMTSRVLCPLVGGDFTYASAAQGQESAPGQMTVSELREIYGMMAEWQTE